MGLLGKIKGLFNRRTDEGENVYGSDWEEESLKRDDIDMHDQTQREQYVKACMEQMTEASKELDTLGGEYNLVTAYLTDMEEIEAQSEEIKGQLKNYASKILELESNRQKLDKKRHIMKPEDYLRMERIEQYMQYIDKVRKYSKEMELKDAITKSVEDCIRENILRDFLMEQKAEVIKMSIYEFDEEKEMAIIRADERELGREEGREAGLEEGERRITILYKCLLKDERMDDWEKAVDDSAYCSKLCGEYGI